MRLVLKLVAAASLVSFALGFTLPSAQASAAPSLDSFSLQGGPTFDRGDTVSLAFEATAGDADLDKVTFDYSGPCGTTFGMSSEDSPPGTASKAFVPSSRNGPYQLERVDVYSVAGDLVRYWRDGSITTYLSGSSPTTSTHGFDLSSGDLSLVDPGASCTAPALDSFSLQGGPTFDRGDTVPMGFAVSPGDTNIDKVTFDWSAPCGTTFGMSSEGFPPGTASKAFVPSSRNGPYQLERIDVYSVSGDLVRYWRDGSTTTTLSWGSPTTGTHGFDLSTGDLALVASDVSCTAPSLDSFSLQGGPTFDRGDAVSLAFEATAGDADLDKVTFDYSGPCGTTFGMSSEDSPPGTASKAFVPSSRNGPYQLERVDVYSVAGDLVRYWRDGSITTYLSGSSPTTSTHGFDLSSGDLSLVDPGASCTAPALDSFSLQGGPTFDRGDTVPMGFAVSPGDTNIDKVTFDWSAPCGTTFGMSSEDSPPGTASKAFVPSSRNGPYQLERIDVYSVSGDLVRYWRDGSTTTTLSWGSPTTGTHGFDLSTGDMALVASDVSCTAPSLDSFSLQGGPTFDRGDAVSLAFEATAGDADLDKVTFDYSGPCGTTFGMSSEDSPPGTASKAFVPSSRNGPYQLERVDVYSVAGDLVRYWRDGSITTYLSGSSPTTSTHGFDLSSGDLSLVDPGASCTAPALDSFSLQGGPTFDRGDTVPMGFAVSPGDTNIDKVTFDWSAPCGTTFGMSSEGFPPGTASNTFHPSSRNGPYQLERIDVYSVSGDLVRYWRDGSTTTTLSWGSPTTGTHGFDLSTGDMALVDSVDECLPDTEPPTVPTIHSPHGAFQTSSWFTVGWDATDARSGVASYDISVRSAPWNGAFGPGTVWLTGSAATSAAFRGDPGTTYCFTGRANDNAGNTSEWSQERCSAVPLDDRAVTRAGRWTRQSRNGFYLGTYTESDSRGATLRLPGIEASQLSLMASVGPSMGKVEVSWKGRVLARVSLTAPTSVRRQLFELASFPSTRRGTLTIKVISSGGTVEIDGIGIQR